MDLIKLLKKGDTCLTDEPSACTASCPLHMDVKSFIEEIEKGDFKKAYKIMEKRIPFTRIIGKICDHPCEGVCVRKHTGGAINIAELEKVTVDLGFSPNKKSFPIPKNGNKIAVVGGGISGITAAFELDKKGYSVTMYEKTERLGGRLWQFEGEKLSKEIIEEELQIIKKNHINVILNKKILKKELEKLILEYNAVYLGTGVWEDDLQNNLETFQIDNSSVFIGGRLLNKNDSIIYSVSSGKRAAISIDRYLQKISITAAREREGAYITPLIIDQDDVKLQAPVGKTSNIYNGIEAIEEARRCLKCQCKQCVKVCSHLKKYNVTSKNYIRQINHNETIILGTHYANKMINSCTLCGLCKDVCPSCINMKDVISETRESMVEKGKMPISAHDFALKDMEYSNSNHFSLVKTQPGYKKIKYLFYPGCQLPASYPEYVEDAYRYLISNIDSGVGIMLGCCGAPADWAGRKDLMEKNIETMKNTWNSLERPIVILACSTCCSNFKKYLPDIEFISLWEIFDKYGVPLNNKKNNQHILNVHDACTTRENNNIHSSVRNIATTLGYKIEELKFSKEKTKCCGYGGLVYFANREQSEDFIKDRISESDDDYLVYCSMCKDLFVGEGKRTFHILDLIFGDDLEKISLRKGPTLSERHKNRAKLKNNLIKEYWIDDTVPSIKEDYDFNLIIPEEAEKQMEDRLILVEDIEKVINNAEKNKDRFYNPSDSNYLTRLRINNVTYWVKYEIEKENIIVKSVYSHRMEIVEE